MSSLLVIASNTGNTLTFLDFLKKYSEEEIEVCQDFRTSIKDYDHIAIGSYTWSNGKIPKKMKDYLIEHQKELEGKKVFIFGSGNSIYPKFCGAVDGIGKIVTDCGASVKGTFKFEQRFDVDELKVFELVKLISMIRNWSQ